MGNFFKKPCCTTEADGNETEVDCCNKDICDSTCCVIIIKRKDSVCHENKISYDNNHDSKISENHDNKIEINKKN